MMKSKGFTLIELLVVIAIIGLLASVILASLNSARNKGTDAAIKETLTNSRSQAELFYSAGITYNNVCTTAVTANGIQGMILGAAQKLSTAATVGADAVAFTYSATGAAGAAVCHDTATGWAAIVSLKNPTTASSGWCVDSRGVAKESTSLGGGAVTCP